MAAIEKQPASPSHALFTVAGLMRRVRVEASLRRGAADLGALENFSGDVVSVPTWVSAVSHLELKPQYELSDLLKATDADFVTNAYRAVLRRPPDKPGMDGFLTQMRAGTMDKIDVLAELRWSEEGKIRGVHVNGLLAPTWLRRLGRKPVIGPMVRWAHGLLLAQRLVHLQADTPNALGRDIQDLGQHVGRLGDAVGGVLERHEDTIGILHEKLQALESQATAQTARARRLEDSLTQVRMQLQDSLQQLATLADERARKAAAREEAEHASREFSARMDGIYAAFEEEFRGPGDMIRARLAPYITLVREAGVGTPESPVLDLGCGRGEWLQLLSESGLAAQGVDTNSDFVAACRTAGLAVQELDAMSALQAMADASLGAITTMHLVEHLPFEAVIRLLDECYRVLKPGGLLIVETPNPENLRVASHTFYLDPTHRNPLPPAMLRWVVDNRGFAGAEILRLSEHRPLPVLPRLGPDDAAAASLNPLLDWAEIAPDYAIVARKPA